MTKMTDEDVNEALGQLKHGASSDVRERLTRSLSAHIAAVTAEREQIDHVTKELDEVCPGSASRGLTASGRVLWMHATHKNAMDDLRKERDALRERVTALEASVSRLRDGLWARGFAAEYPSESGSVVDCALATVSGAESRLAAMRQRATAIEHAIGRENMAFLLEDDAPAPSEPLHCCGTTTETHRKDCPTAQALKPLGVAPPSEMSGLEGEMAEVPCGNCEGVQPETCATHAPTTAEAFAKVRAGIGDGLPGTLINARDALALLEGRMRAQEATLRALLDLGLDGPVTDMARAALTDAPPVFTLEGLPLAPSGTVSASGPCHCGHPSCTAPADSPKNGASAAPYLTLEAVEQVLRREGLGPATARRVREALTALRR